MKGAPEMIEQERIPDLMRDQIRSAAVRIRAQHPDKPIELVLERLKGFVDAMLVARASRP